MKGESLVVIVDASGTGEAKAAQKLRRFITCRGALDSSLAEVRVSSRRGHQM
jgi:hypothetical protein